jgi:hypothetical protein
MQLRVSANLSSTAFNQETTSGNFSNEHQVGVFERLIRCGQRPPPHVEPAPDHGQCGSTRSEQCDRRNRSYRPTISLPQNLQGRKIATNKFGIREMSANGLAGLGFSLVEEAKLVE